MDGALKLFPRCTCHTRSDHKYDIPAWLDLPVHQPNGFTHPPFQAITLDSIAQCFADDETATGVLGAVWGDPQDEQRVRPRATTFANPSKIAGLAQAL